MTMQQLPRKVAFYQHSIFNGGIEKVIFELSGELLRQGVQVDLVINEIMFYKKQLNPPEALNFVELKAYGFRERLSKLRSYLKAEAPDIVISTGHFSNEIAALTKLSAWNKTKVILSEHTTQSVELRSLPLKSFRRHMVPLMARLSYGLADGVMAVSRGVQQDTERLFWRKKGSIRPILNPVDFDKVKTKATEALDHPWLAPGQPPVILGIGRLEHQKDFPTLLEALVELRKQRDARLIILGEGSQRAAIEARITALGLKDVVCLGGFVSNPYPYLARARVFALSSVWEGLPITLIEALGIGIPIVSTDCPSGPREILEDGKWGSLVPMKSPQALAAALLAQLDKPHVVPAQEALGRFRVAGVVDQYLALAGFAAPKTQAVGAETIA